MSRVRRLLVRWRNLLGLLPITGMSSFFTPIAPSLFIELPLGSLIMIRDRLS